MGVIRILGFVTSSATGLSTGMMMGARRMTRVRFWTRTIGRESGGRAGRIWPARASIGSRVLNPLCSKTRPASRKTVRRRTPTASTQVDGMRCLPSSRRPRVFWTRLILTGRMTRRSTAAMIQTRRIGPSRQRAGRSSKDPAPIGRTGRASGETRTSRRRRAWGKRRISAALTPTRWGSPPTRARRWCQMCGPRIRRPKEKMGGTRRVDA
mmetsp:Transcript_9422/g.25549  ORF Transcript_9422/g.25549 Transcript_9422/m.25549 type:complete len:210 (-) Transcript_9422:482-1111(-)